MIYEIKNLTPDDVVEPTKLKKEMKYPFDKLKPGQYFDIPQLNGYPKLNSIKQACFQYKGTFPGITFRYGWAKVKNSAGQLVDKIDANGDKTIRVWAVATEG